MKNEKTVVDIDYAEAIVPKSARRGIVTMFMIMLGFTFFSARRLSGVGRAEIPIAVVTNVRCNTGSTGSSLRRRDIIRRAVRQQHGVYVAAGFVLAFVGDGFYAGAVFATPASASTRLRRLVYSRDEAVLRFRLKRRHVADFGKQLLRLCRGHVRKRPVRAAELAHIYMFRRGRYA